MQVCKYIYMSIFFKAWRDVKLTTKNYVNLHIIDNSCTSLLIPITFVYYHSYSKHHNSFRKQSCLLPWWPLFTSNRSCKDLWAGLGSCKYKHLFDSLHKKSHVLCNSARKSTWTENWTVRQDITWTWSRARTKTRTVDKGQKSSRFGEKRRKGEYCQNNCTS